MDIQQATTLARQMIVTWGMSEKLGPVSLEPGMGIEKGYYPFQEKDYSDKTAEQIDEEVKRITEEAYHNARELIHSNKQVVENIANALLKYETLDAEDVQVIMDGGTLDKPTVADLLAAEQKKADESIDSKNSDESKTE